MNLVFAWQEAGECGRGRRQTLAAGAGRFAARLAGSELLERAALLLLDDDGLQIGDALLQLVDEHILFA